MSSDAKLFEWIIIGLRHTFPDTTFTLRIPGEIANRNEFYLESKRGFETKLTSLSNHPILDFERHPADSYRMLRQSLEHWRKGVEARMVLDQ